MTDARVKFQNIGDSALKAEIQLKGTPEKVYAAWTKQELFPKWFCPKSGGHLQVDHFDCTVGGRYDVTMVFADGDRAQMFGKYQKLDPPKKIVFTWQWSEGGEPSNETLVTVDLAPVDTGTHLTLTHERFMSVADRDNHQGGWGPLLERLDSILAE